MAATEPTPLFPAGDQAPADDFSAQISRMQEQLVMFAKDFKFKWKEEVERSRELRAAYLHTARTLAFMAERMEPTTGAHLDWTRKYGLELARRIDPDLADDPALECGFLLHDVGKFGIREDILKKPESLTRGEWEIMRTHPLLGGQLLDGSGGFLARAVPIIEQHHERWDGDGYPRGLRGDAIHIGARIFAVVDCFDAMTANRPYRQALPLERAVEEIEKGAGTQFDPDVARAFTDMLPDIREMHEVRARA